MRVTGDMTGRDAVVDLRRVQDRPPATQNRACGATRIERPSDEHRDRAVAAPRPADAVRARSRGTSSPARAADGDVAVLAADTDAGPSRRSGRTRL